MSLLGILIAVHVVLAVALFIPSLLLPFTFRTTRGALAESTAPGPFVSALLWFQARGSYVIGAGLAATGISMAVLLGPTILSQPWLALALLIYAANLALAFFIQRPGVRRLLRMDHGGEAAAARWRTLARRQRYVSYVMAGAVGVIAFLMSTKPSLW